MKKNRTMRIATLMLALTLITCCFVGSTFAKYTSTATGTDTVKVAKWSVAVGDNGEIATTGPKTFTFNLFDTVSLDDNGTDVKAGLIAPGTKGSFSFDIVNNSEVTAEYGVTYDVTHNNIPLEFSLDGNTGWTKDLTTLNVDIDADTDANDLAMEGDSDTVKVFWRWVFEVDAAGNTADTALGVATPEYTVDITVDVQQVD